MAEPVSALFTPRPVTHHPPGAEAGLRLVAREHVVGLDEVQLAGALLVHADPGQAARRGHQRLLHAGRVDDGATMEDG